MRIADTPDAQRALAKAFRLFDHTYNAIVKRSSLTLMRNEGDQYVFTAIWHCACEINRLLGKYAVTEKPGKSLHHDVMLVDDGLDDIQNKPYKGSDSVPF